jgi:hypothetical protein
MANRFPSRYQNDQFYNFSKYEGGIKPGSEKAIGDRDNPGFLWPASNHKNAITGTDTKLKRGYMRMLTESYGTDAASQNLAKRRFNFQFNPDVLVRTVSARNDVQFWMNQDPSQFVNPIPGQSNFAFTFILNREAEVASGTYRNNSNVITVNTKPTLMPGETQAVYAASPGGGGGKIGTTVGEYNPSSVTDIGVLADLMVFDQVIGQGLNQDLANKLLGKITEYTTAYNSTLTAGASAGTTDAEDQQPLVMPSDLSDYLSGNIGNSAFLIAQPIRVVFSSLYMVEGFISSTTVTFNKFNLSMVPTQCTVEVQMEAMYIGFATKDTFLTRSLGASIEGTQQGSSEEDQEAIKLQPLADDLINRIVRAKTSIAGNLNPFGDDDNRKELKISDILSKGDSTHFDISIVPTNTYDVNKDFIAKTDATMSIKITYKGRQGISTPPEFQIGKVIYETSAQSEVSWDSAIPLLNAKPTSFEITKLNPSLNLKYDTVLTAKYLIEVTIGFVVTGTQSGQATSKQYATASKTILYGQAIDGDAFSVKTTQSSQRAN